MTHPIAEIFHSIQGEGYYTGTPMMFVRLAGCNVGRYIIDPYNPINGNGLDEKTEFPFIENKTHSICTTFDGQRFLCDTDYHKTSDMPIEEIASQLLKEKHVCITGGEPFLHDLADFYTWMNRSDIQLHIETSGTVEPKNYNPKMPPVWVTCCPKEAGLGLWEGIYDLADEWKVLVGPNFNRLMLDELIADVETSAIYLQPINGVEKVWQENLDRCLKLLEDYPGLALSAQLHKFIGVR